MKNKQNKIRTNRGALISKDKQICDLTYGKITIESHFDKEKNQRYIKKSEINSTKWASDINLKDYRTLDKRLKYLIKIGLVQEQTINGVDYLIIPTATEHFLDIEEETFKTLVASCHKNLIKVYLFLYGWNHYCRKRGTKYNFSLDSLNGELGLPKNTNNREKTGRIIDMLERLGLIVLADEQIRIGKGYRYVLLNAFDCLPSKQDIEIDRTTREKRQTKLEASKETKTPTLVPTIEDFIF